VFAVAMSVKIVPIVVLPTLLLIAARLGRRQLGSFAAGAAVILLPLWGPVVLQEWQPFRKDVLGYAGIPVRQWGPVEFLTALHAPPGSITFIVGRGRFVMVLLSALLPALLLAWRRDAALPAIGLCLALFLLLSPAFSTQYLAWPLAAAYLIELRAASAYNLAAGAILAEVYNRWNGGLPWYEAKATPLRPKEVAAFVVVVWGLLLLVAIVGLRRIAKRSGPEGPPPAGQLAAVGLPSSTNRVIEQIGGVRRGSAWPGRRSAERRSRRPRTTAGWYRGRSADRIPRSGRGSPGEQGR
jgi:hypothetical protein